MRDRHRHRRIVSVSVMIMTHETDTLRYVTFQCILKERSPLHYIILYNAKLRKKIFSISSEQGVYFTVHSLDHTLSIWLEMKFMVTDDFYLM